MVRSFYIFWNMIPKMCYNLRMITKVRDTIYKYNMIGKGDTVFVALSAGADSVCLFFVLRELSDEMGFELEAIHVEHGIREGESLEDMEFVKALCEKCDIPLHIYRVDAPFFADKEKCSLEEAARFLRYQCFDKHAGKGKIAIAHHMNDNAETILFNLVRGSGIEGLRGIKKVRGAYIRPLILCERWEIQEYLKANDISYREDSTNRETDYTRNNIRHNIMPLLTKINAGAVKHFSETAEILDMTADYTDKQSEEAYVKYVAGNSLDSNILNEELIIIKTVIHKFLCRTAGSSKDITGTHVDTILDLCKGNSGREAHLPYRMKAYADYEGVKIVKEEGLNAPNTASEDTHNQANDTAGTPTNIKSTLNNIGDTQEVEVSGVKIRLELILNSSNVETNSKTYTKVLDYDKIISGLSVRTRLEGDYIVINDKGSKKPVSRYMIDEKIPKRERDSVPLICDGNHVMYVAGHRISEHYKIDDNTKRVLRIEVCVNE